MKNGSIVAAFEREFAQYVGAEYAIALCNGTATLHTALVALGVKPGDRVAVPPLTMSATTIAVLHAGGVPVFCDVDPATWLMTWPRDIGEAGWTRALPVSLYGLHQPLTGPITIDDAAQTLRSHNSHTAFTSYSFQASKILALGEGGMLVTDNEELATQAREFSSLGYRMRADQPRIDPTVLKSPTFDRHHSLGFNYRMSDIVAERGLAHFNPRDLVVDSSPFGTPHVERLKAVRHYAANLYRTAIDGCTWLTPQHVPEGWTHDYWTYAVAVDTPERARALADTVVNHGGERPYPAWKLTYHEPAFRHLAPDGTCPIAEDLQPRLLQFQTNSIASAERNAEALRKAIHDIGGSPH